jgi:hypothetical protein
MARVTWRGARVGIQVDEATIAGLMLWRLPNQELPSLFQSRVRPEAAVAQVGCLCNFLRKWHSTG